MAFVSDRRSEWQDWATLCFGVLLFFSPWLFAFTGIVALAWNAWIGGVLAIVLAILALQRFAEWEEWVTAALGVWLVASPWLLGFTGFTAGVWSAVVLGALILASSAWSLLQLHGIGRHGRAH